MNRIRFDDFELEIGFMATCEGVVITERELHCFYMAVQAFPYAIVWKAICTALCEVGRLGDLVTPTHLKYCDIICQYLQEAWARGLWKGLGMNLLSLDEFELEISLLACVSRNDLV